MPVVGTPHRITLSAGALRTNLTSQGLLKILRRTESATRDDGRWYVDPAVADRIAAARGVLGLDRTKGKGFGRGEKIACRAGESGRHT